MATSVPNSARRAMARRGALLCSTALVAAALAFAPRAAQAQQAIDGGAHEIVDGDGPGAGAPPSTRPSPWNVSGDLYVGDLGTGLLTVRNRGQVSNNSGYVGWDAGSTGTATVTGAGSAWTNSQDLYVGGAGQGVLTVQSGGAVSSGLGFIGQIAGSEGSVVVTGAGSALSNTSELYVGLSGRGALTIAEAEDQ